MKKIVFLSAFCLVPPWMVSAQSIDDDLYYTPSKDKKEKKQEKKRTSAPAEEIVVKVECTDYGLYVAGEYYCCSSGS